MTNNDTIVVEWIVEKMLWWWNYQVKLIGMDMLVTAYSSWKMKKFNIKIIEGDKVQIELNEYDPSKWRIIYRFK